MVLTSGNHLLECPQGTAVVICKICIGEDEGVPVIDSSDRPAKRHGDAWVLVHRLADPEANEEARRRFLLLLQSSSMVLTSDDGRCLSRSDNSLPPLLLRALLPRRPPFAL